MLLKNKQTRNVQMYFYKKDNNGVSKLDFVHIPAGATVELDDKIYKALLESKTEVKVLKEVVQVVDGDVAVKMGKEDVTIKEYYETGETKVVNLFEEDIKAGLFEVLSRPKVSMQEVEALLTSNGIALKDLNEDAKLALYDKLV